LTKRKAKTKELPKPAYIAENNYGDYVTVAGRILRGIYQYIVNENQSLKLLKTKLG